MRYLQLRSRTRVGATGVICTLALLVTAVAAAPAAAGAAPTGVSLAASDYVEITHSARGTSVADAATQRWAASKGIFRDRSHVRVYEATKDGHRSTIVLPSYVRLVDAQVTLADGGVVSTAQVEVSLRSALGLSGGVGSGWNHRASDCFAREENSTGWIDSCYKINQYNTDGTDGTSTHDIFQLEHYATAKSKGVFTLNSFELTSDQSPSSDPFRDWVDWDPGSDADHGNCGSYSIGISYSGVGITSSFTACDRWDITKWSDYGHFRNTWRGDARRSEREVGYMTAIKVSQGGWPVWSLWDTFAANLL